MYQNVARFWPSFAGTLSEIAENLPNFVRKLPEFKIPTLTNNLILTELELFELERFELEPVRTKVRKKLELEKIRSNSGLEKA